MVYIQKKIGNKWCTILTVREECAHRVCDRLMKYGARPELKIVRRKVSEK